MQLSTTSASIVPSRRDDVEGSLQIAEQHLLRSEYASALLVLKQAYCHNVLRDREIATHIARCYVGLGRDFLARQVEQYLDFHLRVEAADEGFHVYRGDKHVGSWIDGALVAVAEGETVPPFEVAELVKHA